MTECLPVSRVLCLGGGEYEITGVLGRGACAVTYKTLYTAPDGRRTERIVKEFCPSSLRVKRLEDGSLSCAEAVKNDFLREKEKFIAGGIRQNALRNMPGLRNETPPLIEIHEANATAYLVVTLYDGISYSHQEKLSVRDNVKICLAAAKLVAQYHRAGYLCLDLKPDNFYVLTNSSGELVTDMIEYVDFDSVYSLSGENGAPLSEYTEEWAAPEQRNIFSDAAPTFAADIYSLGEMVFYAVFGRHSLPSEHRFFSRFDFDSVPARRDELLRVEIRDLFTAFFHRTLCSACESRYESAAAAADALERLSRELDKSEFVLARPVPRPACLFGRKKEYERLSVLLKKESPVFVCGLPGSGKSTLVRAFGDREKQSYDLTVYLRFRDSMKVSFCDDRALSVNTVTREPTETQDEYYARKLRHFDNLTAGKKTLIIVDGFCGDITPELADLAAFGRKVIVTAAKKPPKETGFPCLELGPIEDPAERKRMFENCLERGLTEEEDPYFQRISDNLHGHTLMTELIGKLVAAGVLTVKKASEITAARGYAAAVTDKIELFRDNAQFRESLGDILKRLFDLRALYRREKEIMRLLSLLPAAGAEKDAFVFACGEDTPQYLDGLEKQGWVYGLDECVCIHPVIAECVLRHTPDGESGLFAVFGRLCGYEENVLSLREKEGKGSLRVADDEKIRLAADVCLSCVKRGGFLADGAFCRLYLVTASVLPVDCEEFITGAFSLLYENGRIPSADDMYLIADKASYVYAERGDFDACLAVTKKARRVLYAGGASGRARYHALAAQVYDGLLGGALPPETQEEKKLYSGLKNALSSAIRSEKLAARKESGRFAALQLLSLADVLLRGGEKPRRSLALLAQVKDAVSREFSENSDLAFYLNVSFGWYYTLAQPDAEKTRFYCEKAKAAAKNCLECDLDVVDFALVPFANMLYYHSLFADSTVVLEEALALCEKHGDAAPFVRKRAELKEHLLDVTAAASGGKT